MRSAGNDRVFSGAARCGMPGSREAGETHTFYPGPARKKRENIQAVFYLLHKAPDTKLYQRMQSTIKNII